MQSRFCRLVLALSFLSSVLAQSIGITIFPAQVVTGLTYTVAWTSNGQPATVELLRNGARQDVLFTSDGTVNSFLWAVEDDYDAGTNYALQITSGGTTALTSNIWVIEDEDGLTVSGSTIFTPSPTALATPGTPGTIASAASAATSDLSSVPGASSATSGIATPGTTSSPTSVAEATAIPPSAQPYVNKSLGAGAIVGIVIGVIGGLLILGAGIWFCVRRRRQRNISPESAEKSADSFLALRGNGGPVGTAKGTSPEVYNVFDDKKDIKDGATVNMPELQGDSAMPTGDHTAKHLSTGSALSSELDGRPISYELAGDNAYHGT